MTYVNEMMPMFDTDEQLDGTMDEKSTFVDYEDGKLLDQSIVDDFAP